MAYYLLRDDLDFLELGELFAKDALLREESAEEIQVNILVRYAFLISIS